MFAWILTLGFSFYSRAPGSVVKDIKCIVNSHSIPLFFFFFYSEGMLVEEGKICKGE